MTVAAASRRGGIQATGLCPGLTGRGSARVLLVVACALGLIGAGARAAEGSPALQVATAAVSNVASESSSDPVERGMALRNAGSLDSAIAVLTRATREAQTPEARARAAGELGATLIQAHRYEEASAVLQTAYGTASGATRASIAIDLGNLSLIQGKTEAARVYFESALADAPTGGALHLAAQLNAARLAAPAERLTRLSGAANAIGALGDTRSAALYRLNVASQAHDLGVAGNALAYANLEDGRRIADAIGDVRLQVEARDALSGLYEQAHRDAEALAETRAALQRAARLPAATSADLLISLEWREARLTETHASTQDAVAAYRRAVAHVESVRQDIPIDYQDGHSSYTETLAPIYLGLVNLLLKEADGAPSERSSADLERAREVLESLRQAEMQDYLGDRCTVEALQGGNARPQPGTAFLYPVILPDRLELLLQTDQGITRATSAVGSASVGRTIRSFALELRTDSPVYPREARQLYDWILRPFEAQLTAQHIATLIVVSDGPLRLVPVGAFSDGRQFALEKYAVATVTGLSMTNASTPSRDLHALVAGMSQAGPVADRLAAEQASQASEGRAPEPAAVGTHGATRGLPTLLLPVAAGTAASSASETKNRDALALPGVRAEVEALARTLKGESLLDDQFTVGRFDAEASSGQYRIVHIASHGYFGGNARDSYILAYDDLVSLEDLQSLLKSDRYRQQPIELLSLSACETAEGNERSPLGMAGAAMKARAKSVLGTLWPVEDDAARAVMESFYTRLEGERITKAEALREAQLTLIHDPRTANPFFWAPFVLVGNWL